MNSVVLETQAAGLDWIHPGPKELATAADFIQLEDQMKLDAPFAVPATFDPDAGKFVSLPAYA